MLPSHFILLPNLFFIQVQEVLVLATGETSIQDGNMVVRYYVGLEIIIQVVFLTTAKEKIKIITLRQMLRNHMSSSS